MKCLVWFLVAVCALFIAGQASASLIDGLVAHYMFERNADDSSATGNHGSIFGGVGYTTGVFGSAAVFDGINDYIRLPANANLSFGATDFSVGFWFKSTDTQGYLLDERSGPERGYVFNLNPHFGIQDGSVSGSHAYAGSYQDGQWHLAVGVRKGTDVFLYIDGILQDQDSASTPVNVGGSNPIYLGRRFIVQSSDQYYGGLLDDLRIYNRALSESEIQQLATIPEPSTLVLLGISALGIIGLGYRRRRAK